MAMVMDQTIQTAIEKRQEYLESCRRVVEACPEIVQIVSDGKKAFISEHGPISERWRS
jgi:hypothetical protein